ncbi:class I SAM-dependent methyltransferase [Candidatus Woesearchaeota archaeon]|nr:class I SAM-dependent methyltransferase [Candidatus Woesearchaeota archaeon]
MKTLTVGKCPLCSGSDRAAIRVSRVQNFESAVVECAGCKLRYLDRVYPPEKLYAEHSAADKDLIETMRPEDRDYARYLRELEKGRMLEVGFGSGRLLRQARQLGFDVAGNEISDSEAARQLRKEGFKITIGDVRQTKFRGRFDIIFLSHVIEHLHDIGSYLNAFHALLADKGRLVLLTPNYKNAFRFLLRFQNDPYRRFIRRSGVTYVYPRQHDSESRQWFSTLEFGHTFQFEKRTLQMLVEKSGFKLAKHGRGRGPDLGKGTGSGFRGRVQKLLFNRYSDKLLELADNYALQPFNLQYELFMIFEKT